MSEREELLSALLREAVVVDAECHECLGYSGGDLLERIAAALGTTREELIP